MIQSSTNQPGDDKEGLPRRDWIVLPLLSLLTIVVVASGTEMFARRSFTEFRSGMGKCTPYTDPWIGVKRSSNCTFVLKELESAPTEYHVNSRGYREDADFAPKQADVYRIVMVGSSFGYGSGLPKEKGLSALLARQLSAISGRKVELYNESIPGFPGLPQSIDRRFKDVVDPKPDLILWEMTRWDVKAIELAAPERQTSPSWQTPAAEGWHRVKHNVAKRSGRKALSSLLHFGAELLNSAKKTFTDSKSAFMIQHAFGESATQYIKYSVSGSDDVAGYLKADLSPMWQHRLERFDSVYADVQAKADAAHIPLVLAMLPTRPQAVMISMGDWPPGYDPYKLRDVVGSIVAKHGGMYIDAFAEFRDVPRAETNFRSVDGHPNAGGDALLAGFLAKKLTGGQVPALSFEARRQTEQETGR